MIALSLRKRYLSLVAAGGLSLVGFAAIPVQHVAAGTGISNACSDDGLGDDFPILTSPITLGVEIQRGPTFGTGPGVHVALCYSTTAAGSSAPELTGGALAVDADFSTWSNPNGNLVNAGCFPDSSTPVVAACDFGTKPTVGLAGSNITFTIPFSLCIGVGGCPTVANGPGATGVIVGSIGLCGTTCVSVGSVCVVVDGIGLPCSPPVNGGASVGTLNPINEVCGGPVVAGGLCVPLFPPSCIAVGGNTIATLFIPGLAPQPILLPKQQVYNAGATC